MKQKIKNTSKYLIIVVSGTLCSNDFNKKISIKAITLLCSALNGNIIIIVRSFWDGRGRVASRRGCGCNTRSPKSSRTRNEPRVESESSEREPFLRLSDRALPMCFQHAHFIPIVGVGKRGEY